uniref:Uncharacterized protein n=1 Tax=Clastoptera arizonana TaxID=38151 RepID=A0A1B6ECU5_9HEMI
MYASLEEFEIKLKSVIEKMKHADSLSTSEDDEEEENTPDIGADINLDALSDSDVESSGSARAAKKKRTGFHFKRNEKGETPLHTACINGNLTLVQKLLDQGHPVDIRDHSGWLPLHEACNFGHTEIVKLLLDKGAAINDRGTATCGGMTPLLDAATCGNLSVMELLLERGASPLMRTNQGETVLDCLVAWRERYKQEEHRDLDSETLSYYHDMVQMLRAAIEKAGHKPRGPKSENNSASQATMQRRYSDSLTLSTSNIRRSSSEGKSRRSAEDKCERRVGTSRNENAASEYENAIKALRYKPASLAHQVHTQTKHEEKSPLINQNEVVDDWLIDDMETTGRGVKRKKGHQFEGQQLRKMQESQSLRKNDGGRSCNFRAISPVDCSSDSDSEPRIPSQSQRKNEPTIIESDDSSSSNLAQLTEIIEADDGVTRSQSNEPIRLPLSRKKQISLLSTGVSRQVISRPNEPSTSSNLTQNQRPSPTNISTQLVPCQSVKVRIEQKLLLVPLPTYQESPLTVEWLAKEAARRYHSLEGVEPKLSLSTEDGALLAPDDPISLLLSSPEVHATVSSWNLAPLNHRYKEACTALKLDMDDHIEWSLDACQATTVLCLEDCALLPIQFKPVVKALSHHNALQHLKLSGNQLGDEGVQVLSECVMKLCQLRELDISCNDITQEGFSHLAQQATQHRGLQNLEKLNLSHNPLGEDCLRSLGQVLKCSAALSTLEMVDVGLSPVSFRGCPELSLDSVEHLNLSYNTLDREGVDALLSRLEPTRLISLKLASTGDNIVREVALFFDQRDPYNLQYLDVSYCNADDDDILQLVKSLQHANQLQSLEINGNKLSDTSTLSEIYRLPINRLSMLGVEINDVLPQAPVAQFSCLSLVQQPWGSSGPFGLVTTDTIGT